MKIGIRRVCNVEVEFNSIPRTAVKMALLTVKVLFPYSFMCDCSVWRLFGVLVYLNLCASGMLDSSQVAVVLATTSVNTTLGMVF